MTLLARDEQIGNMEVEEEEEEEVQEVQEEEVQEERERDSSFFFAMMIKRNKVLKYGARVGKRDERGLTNEATT